MEKIGIIAEYNPFHNGHIYHINKIKELYPDSLIILVLNGYFLERGEISFLSKEEKIKIALEHHIDLVIELPVLFGSQSADVFAAAAIQILHNFSVNCIVFGSECNDIKALQEIVEKTNTLEYDKEVKEYLKTGVNYPTALAFALHSSFDFNNPNDLLGISYMKAIDKNKYSIIPETIQRTSDYHDLESNCAIISASNIRNKILNEENIEPYLPKSSFDNLCIPKFDNMFMLLKSKILTTPDLSIFLTVDEGIEARLVKMVSMSNNWFDFIKNVKTKRYTYNKIARMCIHILLGITKVDNKLAKLEYTKVLGFNKKGKEYLNTIKKDIVIPTIPNKNSIQYKYEMIASQIYDLINHTDTYTFELSNKPVRME